MLHHTFLVFFCLVVTFGIDSSLASCLPGSPFTNVSIICRLAVQKTRSELAVLYIEGAGFSKHSGGTRHKVAHIANVIASFRLVQSSLSDPAPTLCKWQMFKHSMKAVM